VLARGFGGGGFHGGGFGGGFHGGGFGRIPRAWLRWRIPRRWIRRASWRCFPRNRVQPFRRPIP
jgi:hypothetical protein